MITTRLTGGRELLRLETLPDAAGRRIAGMLHSRIAEVAAGLRQARQRFQPAARTPCVTGAHDLPMRQVARSFRRSTPASLKPAIHVEIANALREALR